MSLASASIDAVWYDVFGLVVHTIAFGALAVWGLKYAEKQAFRKGDIRFY